MFSASEPNTAQYLRDNSGLCSLYNLGAEDLNHLHLYTIADKLYDQKEAIDKFIYNRLVDVFGLEDSLVIYDLLNTYFEGRKAINHDGNNIVRPQKKINDTNKEKTCSPPLKT